MLKERMQKMQIAESECVRAIGRKSVKVNEIDNALKDECQLVERNQIAYGFKLQHEMQTCAQTTRHTKKIHTEFLH